MKELKRDGLRAGRNDGNGKQGEGRRAQDE